VNDGGPGMMGAEEPAEWFDDSLKDADLRRLINRRYTPEKPRWLWIVFAASFWAMVAALPVASLFAKPGSKDDPTDLIAGCIVGAILVFDAVLWLAIQVSTSLSYVLLEEGGVVVKSAFAREYVPWEDVASAFLVREMEGVSYPTNSITLFASDGRQIRIGPSYDAQIIVADIDQVLALLRGIDTDKPRTEFIVGGGDGGV